EDEEVSPVLAKEELAGKVEASSLDVAQRIDVRRMRRQRTIGLQQLSVLAAPSGRNDSPLLVVGEPAVHDHGVVAAVVVEWKIDQNRPLAVLPDHVVVGPLAKIRLPDGA